MINLEQILSRTEIGKIKVLSYDGILEKEPEEIMSDFVHGDKAFLDKIKPVEIILYRNNYFNVIIAEPIEENFNPIEVLDQNSENVNPDEFNVNNQYISILFDLKREDFENVIITDKNSFYIIDNDKTVVSYEWNYKENSLIINYMISNEDKSKERIKVKLKKEKIDENTSLIVDETTISFFKEGVQLEAAYVDGQLYNIRGYYDAIALGFEEPSKYLEFITNRNQKETYNPYVGITKSYGDTKLNNKFLKYVLKDQTGICETINLGTLLENIKENKKRNLRDMLISLT